MAESPGHAVQAGTLGRVVGGSLLAQPDPAAEAILDEPRVETERPVAHVAGMREDASGGH